MKTKQFILILSLLFLAFFSQCCKDTDSKCIEVKNSSCICPAVFDPVCGCNGITYGNNCEAECNGITSYSMGACK